jgi:hypothetical protein
MSPIPTRQRGLLYHYTSAEAFLGIVGTRTLWATDIRFLNDSEEFTFARDVLVKRLVERALQLRNEHARKLIERELESLAVRTVSAYVVSFSERGNSLSQWRAYAPRDGVSIGFHRGALKSIKDFELGKCYYANELPRRPTGRGGLGKLAVEADDTLRWISRLLQQEWRKQQPKRAEVEARLMMLAHTVSWAALRLKHPGFAEEKEWRLIDNRNPLELLDQGYDKLHGTNFRRGVFGVTPYLVAALPERWRNVPLGIAEVIVGPSTNTTAIVSSIRGLLVSKLRSDAMVVPCDIPYRSW